MLLNSPRLITWSPPHKRHYAKPGALLRKAACFAMFASSAQRWRCAHQLSAHVRWSSRAPWCRDAHYTAAIGAAPTVAALLAIAP